MLATNGTSVRAALTLIIGVGAATIAAAQTTYYVNGSCGDDSWTGLSPVCEAPNGPKATIQAGIDAADHFDEVVVADGLYRGEGNKNLEFFTKEMSVRSTGGPGKCIIDCENDGFGFTFCTLPDDRPVTIAGFTIRNGRHFWAGGICITVAEVTIDNCVIEQCVGGADATSHAGGILIYGSPVQITRTIIRSNRARGIQTPFGSGGGVYIYGRSEVTIEDSRIEANETKPEFSGSAVGGGISVGDSDSILHMSRCIVIGNRAVSRSDEACGGGLYSIGGIFGASSIIDTQFVYNEALDELSRRPTSGGGAYVAGECLVQDCEFRENAANDGGGVYIGGDRVTMQRVNMADNHARRNGGGLYVRSNDRTLESVRCFGNRADQDGGGAYLEFPPFMLNCEVIGNTALRDGGGVAGNSFGTRHTTIMGNQAGRNGGGVSVLSLWYLTDSLIAQNLASGSGGGISTIGLPISTSFINSTITTNTSGSGGGGLHRAGEGYERERPVLNSIFRDNLPVSVFDNSGRLAIERSNIEGGWPGAGNIDADSRFVDPANGDYRLLPGSPCIDAGDNRSVISDTDLAGNPRRIDDPGMPDAGLGLGAIVDMGAFEFQDESTGFIAVHPRPGLADRNNQLQAGGATPGERIYFVYGLSSGVTNIPGCPGVTIEIANARVAAHAVADGNGNAAAVINVPAAAAGRSALIQALDHSACEVSNLVRYRFP